MHNQKRQPAWRFVLCGLFALLMTSTLYAQNNTPPDPTPYAFVEIANGFEFPTNIVHAGDGSGRLFVTERTGKIWIMQPDGTRSEEPFLDLSERLYESTFRPGSEYGLVGLAFHPNYAENGRFFVTYDGEGRNSTIARYTVSDDPNRADDDSEVILRRLQQPFRDHNIGQLQFGPDGYLYVGVGDGGFDDTLAADPYNNGQRLDTIFGSILRLNVDEGDPYTIPEDNPFVDQEGAEPEIWAYGLRSPWRFTFDSATGDLYIGDVGRVARDEINFQPADSPGGENYGWSYYEGTYHLTDARPYYAILPDEPEGAVMPVAEIVYGEGGTCSLTGGLVYRGEAFPDLQGVYFFGDFCSGRTWSLVRDDDGAWQTTPFIHTDNRVVSFGADEAGELYLASYDGRIAMLQRVED